VLAAYPQLRVKRLPSYSPQLHVIERCWRVLRRRATHNRLFAHMAALRVTLRHNLCYYQSLRQKVLSLNLLYAPFLCDTTHCYEVIEEF